jgi:ABC-type branched-subunit amino acid transport system substrate-binding protein
LLNHKNKLSIILVIIYVSIFVSLFILTESLSEKKDYIYLGVMSPSTEQAPKYNFVTELAQEKINSYCNTSNINQRFIFNTTNAAGDPKKAYEITKKYHEKGINLIVGYSWNSHLNASLEYARKNQMVLVSPTSTSPKYAQKDLCYRLLPDDEREAKAVAIMMIKYGIENVIIIQRHDTWGKTYADYFMLEYRAEGGKILDQITYKIEQTQTIKQAVNRANEAGITTLKRGMSNTTAVFIIALEEAPKILLEAENSSSLMNLTWFCTETNTADPNIINKSGNIASKVTLIGPLNIHIYNEDYQEINKLYTKRFDEPLDFEIANVYDGCWLLALSVIEAKTSNDQNISTIFKEVAYDHYGITGPLDVNKNGDRSWIRYYFYGYYELNENLVILRIGSYTRLERFENQGARISRSPFNVIYDNFPFYIWEKQYESKIS